MSQDAANHLLSLRTIASWRNLHGISPESEFRASIPALQRGLVWRPRQNELLWDSILRGFPIGALVVSKWSERLKKTAETTGEKFTHHLLDGQQRCFAITLGFLDPFTPEQATVGKKIETILWLDLNPKNKDSSTRSYWVRATTTAHPWGYAKNDGATPLGIGSIRDALKLLGLDYSDPNYRRPSPIDLWPCKSAAEVPVPLSWLMRLPLADEKVFWDLLRQRAAEATCHQWAAGVHAFCEDTGTSAVKASIFKGIIRAHNARLVALEVTDELLDESEDEKAIGIDQEKVTTNIEHLFQRLNQEGTTLDGEELAYSMIKAHWPELESEIDRVSAFRMPQARMVSLGVRAALAVNDKEKLPGPPSVSALRSIARTETEKKALIQNFIEQDLLAACERVDQWLKYDSGHNRSGLLPVHVTSIALGSREIYLLLLHFAKRMSGKEASENWPRSIQALATLVHWFAYDKAKVSNRIYAHCRREINVENIRIALDEATAAGELSPVHSPQTLDQFIQLPESNLEKWNWWVPILGDASEDGIQRRRNLWEFFLQFRFNKELLLYAQRDFVARRFADYDPARKDLWEEHNRPWDFDHILAWHYFYNRKDGSPFRGICSEWGFTIGNFRAWPFEDNRSDQAEKADSKIKGDPIRLRDSFLTQAEEKAFSGGEDVRSNPALAQLFVVHCRTRLLRIYKTWYESVGVAELIPATDNPTLSEIVTNTENAVSA